MKNAGVEIRSGDKEIKNASADLFVNIHEQPELAFGVIAGAALHDVAVIVDVEYQAAELRFQPGGFVIGGRADIPGPALTIGS